MISRFDLADVFQNKILFADTSFQSPLFKTNKKQTFNFLNCKVSGQVSGLSDGNINEITK